MDPLSEGIEWALRKSTDSVLETLYGIPEQDLIEWIPAGVSGEANTFAGIATHIAGAGEFWVLEAAGGMDQHRYRPDEFASQATIDQIAERYKSWLAQTHDLLVRLSEDDLARMFVREANPEQGVSAMELPVATCLTHAVEHTAIHLGHLQIHRQLWELARA